MITYSATNKKFTDGGYTSFELGYYPVNKKEMLKIIKHNGELMEDAVLILKREVDNFPPGTKFEISAKKNSKDNASTADVWQFSNSDVAQQHNHGWPSQQYQQQPFGGFGSFIDPTDLKEERKRLDLLKEELTKKEFELILRENELKRNQENHERIIKDDKERLGELEKKYNSTAAAAQRGFEMVLGEAFTTFGQDGHFGRMGAKLMGIPPGALAGAQEDNGQEQTAEGAMVEKLATDLFELGLSLDQYKEIYGMVMKTLSVKGWIKKEG